MSLIDSLVKLIEKAQNKPRQTRVKILWVSVALSTFFIVSLWVTSFKNTMPQVFSASKSEIKNIKESIESGSPSLMGSLKDGLTGGLKSFFQSDEAEQLEELLAEEEVEKETEEESIEALPEDTTDQVQIIFESAADQEEKNDDEIKPVELPQVD